MHGCATTVLRAKVRTPARVAGHDLDDDQAAKLVAYTTDATNRFERLRDRLAAADRIALRLRRLAAADGSA